jgi:hypothetical protein
VITDVTAAAYLEAMNRDPRDHEYRRAFQSLAQTIASVLAGQTRQ